MKTMKTALAVSLMLLATNALAAPKEKDLICHVGNEAGPNGEVYLDDPGCVPHEDNDYFCPDAGKIDLIEVGNSRKHLGTDQRPSTHEWDGISDYHPEDIEATGEGKEDTDGDGVDEGCEPPTLPGECPCWAGEDLSALTLEKLYPDATPIENFCFNSAQELGWALQSDSEIELAGYIDMVGQNFGNHGNCFHRHAASDGQIIHTNDQYSISPEDGEICMTEALYVGSQLGVSCID